MVKKLYACRFGDGYEKDFGVKEVYTIDVGGTDDNNSFAIRGLSLSSLSSKNKKSISS